MVNKKTLCITGWKIVNDLKTGFKRLENNFENRETSETSQTLENVKRLKRLTFN
ncbi:hypothetical protein HanRHA438_Chr14g0656471 [Helianthus annuus]|nr:hypothetical protein HanRHA438_Chr14g0656471 [Helianthus annuus]